MLVLWVLIGLLIFAGVNVVYNRLFLPELAKPAPRELSREEREQQAEVVVKWLLPYFGRAIIYGLVILITIFSQKIHPRIIFALVIGTAVSINGIWYLFDIMSKSLGFPAFFKTTPLTRRNLPIIVFNGFMASLLMVAGLVFVKGELSETIARHHAEYESREWKAMDAVLSYQDGFEAKCMYQVNGKVYRGTRISAGLHTLPMDEYQAGDTITVHYDPSDPRRASIFVGVDWFGLMMDSFGLALILDFVIRGLLYFTFTQMILPLIFLVIALLRGKPIKTVG